MSEDQFFPVGASISVGMEGTLSPIEVVQHEDFSYLNGRPTFRANYNEIKFYDPKNRGYGLIKNLIEKFAEENKQYSIRIMDNAPEHLDVVIADHSSYLAPEQRGVVVGRMLFSRWMMLMNCMQSVGTLADLYDCLFQTIRKECYQPDTENYDDGTCVSARYYFMPNPRGSDDISHSQIHYRGTKKLDYAYYPSLDLDQMFDDFMASKESILFIKGLPGVGKTCLINALFNRAISIRDKTAQLTEGTPDYVAQSYIDMCNDEIFYVKDPTILCRDSFWADVMNEEPPMLVLDDFKQGIGPRHKYEDNSFVERLLSVSDGVFENKTKVIITTNNGKSDIDDALMRPGRCFDFIELSLLTADQVQHIWKEKVHGRTGLPENFPLEIPKAGMSTGALVQIIDQYLKAGRTKRYRL